MKYSDFVRTVDVSQASACREIYRENKDKISIRKEKTAVRNYVRILDAVFEISYEKGFSDMTMRDLSRKTGLSMGAMYPYFRSKEELLAIILRQGRAMITQVMETFLNAHESPADRLRAVIKAHIFLSEKARPWFYFMFMEARNLEKKERKAVMEAESYTEKILTDILEAGASAGIFRERNHSLTAGLIKAMQQDWYLKRWKYAKSRTTVDAYADHVMEFVTSFCLTTDKNEQTGA